MPDVMDFPANPSVGQTYTNSIGIVYQWDGVGWIIAKQEETEAFYTVGDLLLQIRTLLQDTDNASGEYRYTDDSIFRNINQGLLEMYRIRPDLFLELRFTIPRYIPSNLDALIGIAAQYIPPLIYYVVGLTQLRDDEQNQDARAVGFTKTFTQTLLSPGL